MKLSSREIYKNLKQRLTGKVRDPRPARPVSAFDDSSASFNSLLPLLAEKWREVPGGSDMSDRRFTDELLNQADAELLKYWGQQYDTGVELRGWWWRLYRDIFRNRKVLEIGSGMGFDATFFASQGASLS